MNENISNTQTVAPSPATTEDFTAQARSLEEISNQEESVTKELKDDSKQAVSEVREVAARRAKGILEQTGEKLNEKAGEAINLTESKVRNFSRALSDASERMESEQPSRAVEGTRFLAERVDRIANYLERRNPDEIANDFRQVVHEHPGITLGAAAVAGLVAGRVLKAESPQQSETTPQAATA